MKKISAIILLLIMLVNVAACSGKDVDSDDPNIGMWNAVSGTMFGFTQDITEVFDNGASLELKANEKFTLMMDGEKANGKWQYSDDGLILTIEGVDFPGKIENGILTLTNMLDMGLDLTFEKEGGYAGVTGPTPKPSEEIVSEPAGGLSEVQQWWDGDWYGYWEPHSVTDDYIHLDDGRWDIYAVIEMDLDDTGTIYLWEDGEDFATVDITVSEDGGSGDMGAAFSESGNYWSGVEIGHADWIIDPTLYGYDNYMVIDGQYEDEDGEGFYYVAYLRPWGQLWDDIPEDERPPWYADWYLAHATDPMLQAILDEDGSGYIHSQLGDVLVTEKPPSQLPTSNAPTETPAPSVPTSGEPIEVEFVQEGVTVSATLPGQGWCHQDSPFGYSLYPVESLDDVYSNTPRIRIIVNPDLKYFDRNSSDFSNLETIGNRTIGGIDMTGRTYEYVGLFWTEYLGTLNNGKAVSVNSSKVDVSSGEGSAVLDSIKFK